MTLRFNTSIAKKILTVILFSLLASQVFSQAYSSTEAHTEKVTSIVPLETPDLTTSSFFSSGSDGFVIKWNADGSGEHYQISDMQIALIARNPVNNDIAVYETDGASNHKITVLDWKTYAKKYSRKYRDSVTSLSYSANGTYLIVGTATVNGIYILNSKTGSVTKKVNDISSVISMAKTGETEQTAVFYSQTGSIIYYDLKNFKVLTATHIKKKSDGSTSKVTVTQKFNTEPGLEQVVVFGSGSKYLAGTKDNSIYIINAMNGKTITSYAARSPLILTSSYQGENDLYYITNEGRNYTLRMVEEQILEELYKQSRNESVTNPPDSLIVKYFVGLSSRDSFTCAAKNSGTVYMGSSAGNIYTMSDVPESETYTIFPITEQVYKKIHDVEAFGDSFYFLTDTDLYTSSYADQDVIRIGESSGYTNITRYNDNLILWSKESKKTLKLIIIQNNMIVSESDLFTPNRQLQNIRIYGDKIVYVQGNSEVGLYDMTNGKNEIIYSGTSVQDAVLYKDSTLYVAKAGTGSNDSPLISISLSTRETVPVSLDGYVVYSLCSDFSDTKDLLYGILMTSNNNGNNITELFQYNARTNSISSLLKLSDEDSTAFTAVNGSVVYTNLGKNQIYACNSTTKKNTIYRRSASIPQKLVNTQNNILILNKDGSLSWYTTASQAIQSEWHLTTDGIWFDTRK